MDIQKIKPQILYDFSKKAVKLNDQFRKINQTFFAQYVEDILNLKKRLISDPLKTKIPTDIWTAIHDHFDHLHKSIVAFGEIHIQAMNQPFLQEWKEETVLLFDQTPAKFSTSYLLQKFEPAENDNFIHRQLKKYSLRFYRIKHKFFTVFRKRKSFLGSGRKMHLHNFLYYYLVLPTAQFLFDQWNDYLKISIQNFDWLQKTTEQFKDELLAAEKFTDKDIYWRKVINPEMEKIIENYENSLKKIQESNAIFYKSVLTKIHTTADEIAEKSEQSWEVAGTVLLMNRKFNHRKTNSRWWSLSKKYERLKKLWEIHLKILQEEWLKDIDLAQVQLTAAGYWYETGQIIKNKFYNDIVPLFKDIIRKLKETRKSVEIDVKEVENRSEIKNKMILINRKLVKAIREKDLPEVLTLLDPELFSQSFSGFIKRLYSDCESLANEHTVLAFIDMEKLPSKIKSDKVALKDLLQEETFYAAEQKIGEINLNLGLELDAASRSLARIDQVIEYNLEGALNLIREESDEQTWQEAINITQQGLERVEQNIEDLISSLKTQIDNSLKKFDRITTDLEEDIYILGDNEELLKLKIRLTRARTKSRIIEIRKKTWQYIRLFLPELLHLLQNAVVKIRERYSKVQSLAGLGISDTLSELSFTQYLADVEKKIRQMPYIYQRIFRIEPLEDNKFFIGRSQVLDTISQDFEDFKNNYHPITALVGEKGCGKTSTLSYVRRNIFKGKPVTEIDANYTINSSHELIQLLKQALKLPEIQSTHDLINALNNQSESRICILENVHNLFLRTIEGFQALDDLLFLISKTRQNVFWIISCGRYAWEYLETITKISSFFKRVIYLEDLSTEELTKMILDRHQISGYGINFIPTVKIAQSRQYKKLTTPLKQQQYLQDYFFRRLSEAAEGNIRVAIYFWLSAIDEFEESTINVLLDIKFESQFLHQLPVDEILSLAAFIQHEYLNEAQHAEIFNQSYTDSCIFIENLYKKGLLIRNSDDFLIHPYLYRPVVRALKLRNII